MQESHAGTKPPSAGFAGWGTARISLPGMRFIARHKDRAAAEAASTLHAIGFPEERQSMEISSVKRG
jgi:hypothetical protein